MSGRETRTVRPPPTQPRAPRQPRETPRSRKPTIELDLKDFQLDADADESLGEMILMDGNENESRVRVSENERIRVEIVILIVF